MHVRTTATEAITPSRFANTVASGGRSTILRFTESAKASAAKQRSADSLVREFLPERKLFADKTVRAPKSLSEKSNWSNG